MNKLTVVVTRPDPAGSVLCRMLEAAGDQAIHLPTIAFAAPSNNEQLEANSLQAQDRLIFVSPQAVYSGMAWLKKAQVTLPSTVMMAAVGAGTARLLEEAGYKDIVYPKEEWSAEGLLALPAFQSLAGKKIAIIRGDGGREILESVLQSRGAIVTSVIVYQRVLPAIDAMPVKAALKQHKIDIIICTSFTAVDHLKKMVGEEAWPDLQSVPLIVMSERIKTLAHDLGFRTIWVTKNASHLAIMETIVQKRNEICQKKQISKP